MFATYLRKLGILTQETIAWMYCVGIGYFSCSYYIGDIEVAKRTGGWANANSFISKANVQTFLVHSAVNSNGLDAHFLASTNNAEGYFATVGYKYLFEHGLMC